MTWYPYTVIGLSPAPKAKLESDHVSFEGNVSFVPDAPGADLLVVVGQTDDGAPVAAAVEASADGVSIEPEVRYDATRALAHITLAGARGRRLDVAEEALADAWYVAQ